VGEYLRSPKRQDVILGCVDLTNNALLLISCASGFGVIGKSMPITSIALIGDYDPGVTAHRAIPLAIELASREMEDPPLFAWLPTETLVSASDEMFSRYAGFWCVPGSPYQSMNGALRAIRFAREQKLPFLGTCAGFQHALIEYARSVLGLSDADHQESNPTAQIPLIASLQCALVEVEDRIFLREGSRAAQIYGRTVIDEPYHCRFGLNREHATEFEKGSLRISGVDAKGEARVVELGDHPFFFGTQFQPERAALKGRNHPLVAAFVTAVRTSSTDLLAPGLKDAKREKEAANEFCKG
jgi:CTP synthase (UTP-ammonia lyase)